MVHKIVTPDLGESVRSATVVRWLVAIGDRVDLDEPVVELETDKAVVEVRAGAAGVLVSALIQSGESAARGDVLGELRETAE